MVGWTGLVLEWRASGGLGRAGLVVECGWEEWMEMAWCGMRHVGGKEECGR